MKEKNIEGTVESRVCFQELEDWVREKVQSWVQELLEEEVTELLGRDKSERRGKVDPASGYRNGYGKARRLTLSSGTITVRRPRVRDLEERFESRVLPLFAKRTQQVRDLIPELYLHGLAQGDFDLALRGLLGEEAALSANTVARLKEKWQEEWAVWQSRPLEELEVVYLWADGIYVKAGLEKEKAVLLVVLAALSDGSKVVVSVTSGYRESTESWSEVLRDLKRRGMNAPRLVIADGHLGIWGALCNVYPEAEEQRCWNHRIVNILAKVPKREQPTALLILRQIPYAESRQEAERLKRVFQEWCRMQRLGSGGRSVGPGLGSDGELLQLPEAAVATPAHHESSGVPVRRTSAANRCGQALQEGEQRPGCDLEDALGGRETIPSSQSSRAHERCLSGSQVCEWSPGQPGVEGESRLSLFTHLLT